MDSGVSRILLSLSHPRRAVRRRGLRPLIWGRRLLHLRRQPALLSRQEWQQLQRGQPER